MKSEIISRLRVYERDAYTNDELANYIKLGYISLDDVRDTATFLSASDLDEIAKKSDSPKSGDDDGGWDYQWDKIAYQTIERESNNKEHTASQQAEAISQKLQEMLAQQRIDKDTIYKFLRQDHNLLGVAHIKRLIADGVITPKGLLTKAEIRREFIDKLMFDDRSNDDLFHSPKPLDKIHTESTEIYFWGIPSSGKSCLIGAVLSCLANIPNVTISPKTECNGFDYLTTIRDCFSSDDIITLPPGTKTQDFYEMGFDLTDEKGKRHPVTMIDLAGELVKAIYVKNTKPEELTSVHKKALATLDGILGPKASKNHKIHFFVVEYGAEKKFYEGHTQLAYLESTIAYLNRLNVFTRNTDAIYLIVTKTDKAPFARSADRMLHYKTYVDQKLGQFSNALQGICRDKKNEIGVYERYLFTLGDVCFRRYCLVNPNSAVQITKEIIDTTGISRSWGKFLDSLLG